MVEALFKLDDSDDESQLPSERTIPKNIPKLKGVID